MGTKRPYITFPDGSKSIKTLENAFSMALLKLYFLVMQLAEPRDGRSVI